MRQQGADELLTHLLTALRRHARGARARGSSGTEAECEPTKTLAFGLEQRLQCTACAGVRCGVDAPVLSARDGSGRGGPRDVRGGPAYAVR